MKLLFHFLAVFSVVGLIGCNNDDNNNTPGGGLPTITSMTPSSVSIGQQNAVATITGTNLGGTTAVDLGESISVQNFSASGSTSINVTFSVSPNAAPGARTVAVITAAGTANSTSSFQVTNNRVPTAKFTVDPKNGSKDTVFHFDASESTDPAIAVTPQSGHSITSYQWQFGDGASANGKKVTHKYGVVGNFVVILTVNDNGGSAASQRGIEVTKNSPPIARFTVKPGLSGTTNTVFIFDGSNSSDPDGRIKNYKWDFGDGSKSQGKAIVEHTYKNEGNYNASLTVEDNLGQDGSDDARLTVEKTREEVCTHHASNHGEIHGIVVGVEGHDAIVRFGSGATCSNTFYYCGDMRRADPESFYGIVHHMADRGDGTFAVTNDCPYRWPPSNGEEIFLLYKTCTQNHCP